MMRHAFAALRRHGVFYGILFFALSLCLSLHVFNLLHKQSEHPIEITLHAEHLPPEVCEAIVGEQRLLLDGRFALYKVDELLSPTLLRFYDANDKCEFTVTSKKYSDLEITLQAVAREHPFGMALYGVRTVNVGMHLALFGERTKIYGTCVGMRVLDTKEPREQAYPYLKK